MHALTVMKLGERMQESGTRKLNPTRPPAAGGSRRRPGGGRPGVRTGGGASLGGVETDGA